MKDQLIATRKNKSIIYEDGRKDDFKSVNKAKKESRRIQLNESGLGCGSVRVAA